ncbi:hypothetical protein [Pelobacter propionicus]|uniref:Uncharacterized protein n=1 Tax=Pelobacter propionicus (strain DSM 2379 / NBRC 103807 / OttBd1) TaxID=338966 RepID=A0R821_PELPD|nr:hypothetical protein [Pelobacter propionicus]ABL01256.1 conserved hypothetical protein [Pelobacter propionicus DSM 2379]
MNRAIYVNLPDVESRLLEVGLPCVEEIHAAIKNGELHRDSCTANDPRGLPGLLAWGKTVRGLRDTLAPKGWTRFEGNNLAVALDSTGTTAIAVATGDKCTGDPKRTPETKYPKGPAIAAAIEQNIIQLVQTAFSFVEELEQAQQKPPVYTWLLLISRNKNEVHSELSLPRLITEKGHVVEWEERILLPPFPIDDESGPLNYEEENAGDDIVVEISRR